MKIQEEAPCENLLASFDDDYAEAVLHIAWNVNSETKERTLLFAFVELLPAEIPAPIDDYEKHGRSVLRLGGDSKHRVYVRHAVVTATRALEWYVACRAGKAVLPEDDGTLPSWDDSKKRLRLMDFGEEPKWPSLLAASDETTLLPFCPQWIQYPRTHHLLPLTDFDLESLWSSKERELAEPWLGGRLYFDLNKYPEYWGSVHLVAPNPVYRHLDERLQTRGASAESVVMRFEARTGKSVTGLEVTLREKNAWQTTALGRASVTSPLIRMNFARTVDAFAIDVWDRNRGFLQAMTNVRVFPKFIFAGAGLAQTLKIKTPRDAYDVTRTVAWKPGIETDDRTNLTSARARMSTAFQRRKKQQLAIAHAQEWFRGDAERARELLRSLLHEAERDVLLIDPYFGANELFDFALAVGRHDVTIRILTSCLIGQNGATDLAHAMHEIETKKNMNSFDVRMMGGNEPAIHDRFFVVDQRIWHLGNSLNAFGRRGTMILALPDPNAVRADFEQTWAQAIPLGKWLNKGRQPPAREETP